MSTRIRPQRFPYKVYSPCVFSYSAKIQFDFSFTSFFRLFVNPLHAIPRLFFFLFSFSFFVPSPVVWIGKAAPQLRHHDKFPDKRVEPRWNRSNRFETNISRFSAEKEKRATADIRERERESWNKVVNRIVRADSISLRSRMTICVRYRLFHRMEGWRVQRFTGCESCNYSLFLSFLLFSSLFHHHQIFFLRTGQRRRESVSIFFFNVSFLLERSTRGSLPYNKSCKM